MSDHEEEFYYTEVEEENVDVVMQTFADMQTTSPTRTRFAQMSDTAALPDHDYQRKVRFLLLCPQLQKIVVILFYCIFQFMI